MQEVGGADKQHLGRYSFNSERAPGNLTQDTGQESAWVAGQGGLVGSSARDRVVGEGQDSGCCDDDTISIVDGHFVIESLMTMERKDMEALAADLEIPADAIRKCKNKSELAALIAEVEVEPGETEDGIDTGETPPDLGAENPVV